LELRELKAHSLLLGASTSCPLLKSDLEACPVEIEELKHKLDHSSRYSILYPREMCGSLKVKLFHTTKENTELKQEVAYSTSHLERTVMSEKMIEDDLIQVEESATKSIYKLGVVFERCEDKSEKRAPKFVPTSNYNKEEKIIKSTKTHYTSSPKPSFNPKREVREETLKPREEAFICMFCGRAGHLDEFCFRRKRIEKKRFDYGRNSYRDEFTDFRLVLILVRHLAYFMDLIITHIILVYEKTALCLDALVTAHVLIVMIVFCVGPIFLLESLILTLSPDTWTVHAFLIVVHVPLDQLVRC
jgi:hypothetical protein